MSKRYLSCLVLVLMPAVAACAGQSEPANEPVSDEPATAEGVMEYCQADCNYGDRCYAGIPRVDCANACAASYERSGPHLRAAYFSTYASCLAQGCGTFAEECERRAYAAAGTDEVNDDPLVRRCKDKLDGCRIDFRVATLCDQLPILVSTSRDEMVPCFNEPCPEFKACLAPVFELD